MTNSNRNAADIFSGPHLLIAISGACPRNPGPGAWGMVMLDLEGEELFHDEELSGSHHHTTNNEMELVAAIEAFRSLYSCDTRVVVTSHSQYLVNGMTKWVGSWRSNGWRRADGKPIANAKLWQELMEAMGDRQVDWVWLSAGQGRGENKRAKLLAELAHYRMHT